MSGYSNSSYSIAGQRAAAEELTPGDRILKAIVEIGDGDGWPVVVRDVQRRLGYGSPSTVHGYMRALEQEGMIERSPRSPRSGYRATARGRAAVGGA